VLLILLSVLLVLAGGAIGGQSGLKIALGIAVVMNGISYFFSDRSPWPPAARSGFHASRCPGFTNDGTLAGKARLPMPKLYVIPEPAPNAFATGRNPGSMRSVAVDGRITGLMNERTRRRHCPRASHVRNYDILDEFDRRNNCRPPSTYLASMGSLGPCSLAASEKTATMIARAAARGPADDFLAPFAALMLQLFLSRTGSTPPMKPVRGWWASPTA